MKDNRIELAKYRLEKAKTKLAAAQILLEQALFEDSLSRSYYAMFTAARALLSIEGFESRKHSGIISLFNQHFVKSGIVDKRLGRILMSAKDFREESDYGDYVSITKIDAEGQFKNAELFVEQIEKTLQEIIDKIED